MKITKEFEEFLKDNKGLLPGRRRYLTAAQEWRKQRGLPYSRGGKISVKCGWCVIETEKGSLFGNLYRHHCKTHHITWADKTKNPRRCHMEKPFMKKTLHIRKAGGKAIPAGKKAPPINLLKDINNFLKTIYKKDYRSEKEMREDQKKLSKMVDKLPKNKKTAELKKKTRNIDFWDDEERKQQILDIIQLVIGIIWMYMGLRYLKSAQIAGGKKRYGR